MNISWEWHSRYDFMKRKTLSYEATENDSENLSEEEKNVINWHVNNSESNWFSQSQKNDWRQSSRRRMQENKE